jgi:hypothetical protein
MGIFLPRLGPAPAGPFLQQGRAAEQGANPRCFKIAASKLKGVRRTVAIPVGEVPAGFVSVTGWNSRDLQDFAAIACEMR